ncbi:MAG: DUF3857 and transglutaminase domain-containing protein, partial [Hymenobacteraceae bacterium]|nr:DUF3857 and transglutaminase domain-containing protein [Hymenobacteraceae bacterium]
MKKLYSLFCLYALFSFAASAQPDPVKWGNLSKEEVALSSYADYPDAPAVVLCDYGTANYELYHNALRLMYTRHLRIKILNKAGYKYANVEIPYWDSYASEKIISLKAHTINVVNGKQQKTEVSNSEMISENIVGNFNIKKFAFPQVKEGSVIEYSYKIVSDDFTSFRTWNFQTDIPVLHSEYRTRIPDNFTYFKSIQGVGKFDLRETTTYYQTLNLGMYHGELKGEQDRYVLKNVPAFVAEPYLSSVKDYIGSIKYQLRHYKGAYGFSANFLNNWENLSNKLLDHQWLGRQLKVNKSTTELASKNTTEAKDPKSKMIALYNFVKHNTGWNGINTVFASQNLDKVLETGKGSSSEINLLLIQLLQSAGLQAEPLLISTKKHGNVQTIYPDISQFDK